LLFVTKSSDILLRWLTILVDVSSIRGYVWGVKVLVFLFDHFPTPIGREIGISSFTHFPQASHSNNEVQLLQLVHSFNSEVMYMVTYFGIVIACLDLLSLAFRGQTSDVGGTHLGLDCCALHLAVGHV